MTEVENKIPIKGYAKWHPLKHCWVGTGFKPEWIRDLITDKKVSDPLCRIAEETEEDYQKLEGILNQAGVKTYRNWLDIDKYSDLWQMNRHVPPMNPRDQFVVIGEKFYVSGGDPVGYTPMLKNIDKKNLYLDVIDCPLNVSGAVLVNVGKDLYWDLFNYQDGRIGDPKNYGNDEGVDSPRVRDWIAKMKEHWESLGFRVHISERGYHSDSSFAVLKPGVIMSLYDVQNYEKLFPNWDVLYLPEQSWDLVADWDKVKARNMGKWWLPGEENNRALSHFVNTWLNDWVGYVEETVFDVNCLSLDESHVIVSGYNKQVFDYLKKHKIEPIICNFRHRYFWDGGVHCMTQDFYREGEMEDYFG